MQQEEKGGFCQVHNMTNIFLTSNCVDPFKALEANSDYTAAAFTDNSTTSWLIPLAPSITQHLSPGEMLACITLALLHIKH